MSLKSLVRVVTCAVVVCVMQFGMPAARSDPIVSPDDSESVLVKNSKKEEQAGDIVRRLTGGVLRLPTRVRTFVIDPRLLLVAGQPCVFVGQVEGDPASAAAASNEFKALRLLSQYPL